MKRSRVQSPRNEEGFRESIEEEVIKAAMHTAREICSLMSKKHRMEQHKEDIKRAFELTPPTTLLRIDSSDIATLLGHNEFKDILEIIDVYVYQNMHSVAQKDCALLLNETMERNLGQPEATMLAAVNELPCHDLMGYLRKDQRKKLYGSMSPNKVKNFTIRYVDIKHKGSPNREQLAQKVMENINRTMGMDEREKALRRYASEKGYKITIPDKKFECDVPPAADAATAGPLFKLVGKVDANHMSKDPNGKDVFNIIKIVNRQNPLRDLPARNYEVLELEAQMYLMRTLCQCEVSGELVQFHKEHVGQQHEFTKFAEEKIKRFAGVLLHELRVFVNTIHKIRDNKNRIGWLKKNDEEKRRYLVANMPFLKGRSFFGKKNLNPPDAESTLPSLG